MKSKILKVSVIFSFGIFISIFIAEILLRTFPYFEKKYSIKGWGEGNFLDYSDFDNETYYSYSKHMGYIPKIGSFKVNSLSMYDKEYGRKKKTDSYRIVFLGDSVIADNTVLDQLENALNHAIYRFNSYPGKPDIKMINRIEVLNCAVGGYSLYQYLQYLKNKILDYSPDMIIIVTNPTDINFSSPVIFKKNQSDYNVYINPIFASPALMVFLNKFYISRLLYSFILRMKINKFNNFPYDKKKRAARKKLNEIKDICNKNNLKLLYFLSPHIAPLSELSDNDKQDYFILLNLLETNKMNYKNIYDELLPRFDNNTYMEIRRKPKDTIHYSSAYYRDLATIFFNFISKNLPAAIERDKDK